MFVREYSLKFDKLSKYCPYFNEGVDERSKDSKLITANLVITSGKSEAQVYMVLISLEVKGSFDVSKILVVNTYPNIFFKNIPRLPQKRETMSNFSIGCPILLVKKKDESINVCVDSHKLN
ncbi:hypothetical protein CR513_03661, partial [Mucuna pruriens]